MTTMAIPLEKELETYERRRAELLPHEGKFVIIKDETILGYRDTYNDALTLGYEKAGLKPFLVKQIRAVEPINFISRAVPEPCLT